MHTELFLWMVALVLPAGGCLIGITATLAWHTNRWHTPSAGSRAIVFEMLADLVDMAADVRWEELAQGAPVTIPDRQMLHDLYFRAREVARIADKIMEE